MVSAKKKKGARGGGEVGREERKQRHKKSTIDNERKGLPAQKYATSSLCGRFHVLHLFHFSIFHSTQATHTPPRHSRAGGGTSKGRRGSSLVLLRLPSLSVYHSNSFSRSKQRNTPQKIHPHSLILSIYAAVCTGWSSLCRKPWAYLARLGWSSCGLCIVYM